MSSSSEDEVDSRLGMMNRWIYVWTIGVTKLTDDEEGGLGCTVNAGDDIERDREVENITCGAGRRRAAPASPLLVVMTS